MNKSRNSVKADSNAPNSTLTHFVRKTAKLETERKAPLFESNLNKGPSWIKKQNQSWKY